MNIHRIITALIAVICAAACIHAAVRPGKGMDLVPGDVAEFYTVKYSSDGKVSAKLSSIMVAVGSQGAFEQVRILSVIDEKVKSSQTVLYDLSKERLEEGELVESGNETVKIHGKSYECSWQKRRSGASTATFWRCPELPFEHLAKMLMETPDGQKQITELVYFGPPDDETEESRNFQVRLKRLLSQ